jgi:hypothetical protein
MAARMSTEVAVWRYKKPAYGMLAVAAIAYVILIYHNALSNHGSASSLRLFILSATIALPEIAIWLIAFMGVGRLKRYAASIHGNRDGEALNYVANALLLMALYVVTLTMASTLVAESKGHPFDRAAVVLGNHLPLLIVLASASLLFVGALKLNKLVPLHIAGRQQALTGVLYLAMATAFAANFYHIEPQLLPYNGLPRFVISRGWLMLTYVLPHLITWGLGLYACASIANYAIHTKGAIYKELLRSLSQGVLLVFVCTFLAQLFIISNVSLDKLSVNLVLIYGLLLAGSYGFWLIYKGAENLQKIENI